MTPLLVLALYLIAVGFLLRWNHVLAQRNREMADLAWEALMHEVRVQLDAAAAERALTAVRCAMQCGVSVYVVAPDDLLTQESQN